MSNLKIGSDIESQKTDVLPGSGNYILDTGLYPMIVDMAYLDTSASGAQALRIHLKQANGRRLITRHALWVASGDAKGNKNYYVSKDGKKRLLPGMAQADQISRILTSEHLGDLKREKKMVKLFNPQIMAEEPTEVEVYTAMLGKPILVGMHKRKDNKMVRNASGSYDKTNVMRLSNEISKVFMPNRFSLDEIEDGKSEAKFASDWETKFPETFVDDKFKKVASEEQQDDLPFTDNTSAGKAVDSLFDTKDDD